MKTIIASAAGYNIALAGNDIRIDRESGEWAGTGRWQGGRIVDCAARLGETDDESEATYEALEEALQDAIDDEPDTHGVLVSTGAQTYDLDAYSDLAQARADYRALVTGGGLVRRGAVAVELVALDPSGAPCETLERYEVTRCQIGELTEDACGSDLEGSVRVAATMRGESSHTTLTLCRTCAAWAEREGLATILD